MAGADVQRLRALGLLSANAERTSSEASLPVLCAAGALEGGLSVALDVRPDELLGPLCQRMGDAARRLRVVEVRNSPPELWVRGDEKELKWPVPAVPALVRALNRFYRGTPAVRAVADLGVWEDGHQLWCLSKQVLPTLLHEGLLEAENLKELSALVGN